MNNVYLRRTMRVEVRRDDGTPPYEIRYHGLFMLGDIPSAGDHLRLRVDPDKPDRVLAVDAATSTDQPRAATPQRASSDGSIAVELHKLAELHRKGELSDAEFKAAKPNLLGT